MPEDQLLQDKEAEITQLKAEITRLKQEYGALVENAPESVFELDTGGNFTYFNKMVEEKLGYKREELLGRSFTRLLVPERILADIRELEKVLAGKPMYGYKTAIVDAKGRHLLVEISAKPLRVKGTIVGVHGVARTIEEAPGTELYHQLFEAANEPMLVVNREGSIELANRKFLEEFRQEKERVIGRQVVEIGALEPGKLAAILAGGGSGRFSARLKTLDGRENEYRVDYSVVGKDRTGVQLLFVNVNDLVAEEVSLKEELKHLHEEEQSRMDFFHMITHELKTPLTPIKGYLELLLEEQFGPLNARQKESLEIISKSISLSQSLIEDLSSIAKIESGKLQLNLEPVALEKVMADAVAEMRIFAMKKHILLDISPVKSLPKVEADKNAVMRVLTNLVHNAIKFTPENGSVRLSAMPEGTSQVRVCVKDTGIGITQEDQSKLFQKFAQLKSNEEFKGTGLGLSICKGLVEAHNGRIWVESERGKGTLFCFALPLKQPRKPAEKPKTAAKTL